MVMEGRKTQPSRGLLMGEASVSVSVMSILTAVAGLFTGILLIQPNASQNWIDKAGIIVALFAFFFHLSTFCLARAFYTEYILCNCAK